MATDGVETPQRPPHKRTEHIFFLAVTTLVAISVFIGFAHSYFLAGMFLVKLPNWTVHLHAVLFTSWIVLLVVQVVLVATGRVRWHMRLGVLGMFLAPLMVVVGFTTLIAAVRRNFIPPAPLRVVVVADTLSLSLFAGLALAAFLARRNGAEHKRLMLLATCIILGPAIDRWPFAFMESNTAFYIVLNSFVVFLVAYDLWSKRSLHRATVWGVLLTAAAQLSYGPLGHSSFVDRVVVLLQRG
jgi:hypothetical protein